MNDRVLSDDAGVTLVEVLVGMMLVSLLVGGIYLGVVQGTRLNYASAQHVAAFGLCKERLEHMRGVAFTSVTPENFPTETLDLTHLGGSQRLPMTCVRSSSIVDVSSPPRKAVTVVVSWKLKEWSLSEFASGVIFHKDGTLGGEVATHDVGGQLNINPNSSPLNEFILTTPTGTITKDDLHQDYPGYAGPALLVHVKPKGSGNQNTLLVDGGPYPVENANTHDISAATMTVNLYNDNINPQGKAVAASTNGLALDIMKVDFSCARLAYLDQDSDQQTLVDNVILYYTNSMAGGGKVVCTHVTPIGDKPVFSIVPSTPSVAKICFHVGDGTDVQHASFSGTGQGYQGVEVRISATPRNLQKWYD